MANIFTCLQPAVSPWPVTVPAAAPGVAFHPVSDLRPGCVDGFAVRSGTTTAGPEKVPRPRSLVLDRFHDSTVGPQSYKYRPDDASATDTPHEETSWPGTPTGALIPPTVDFVVVLAVLLDGIGDSITTVAGFRSDGIAEAGPLALATVAAASIGGFLLFERGFIALRFVVWSLVRTPGRVAIPFGLAVTGGVVTCWNVFVLLRPRYSYGLL